MFRYPIPLVVVAVVVAIELLLWPLSEARIPFLLFVIAAVPAAFLFDRLKSAAREAEGVAKRTVEILESIRDGFLALDHEFRFTYVNQAAESLMSRPKAELLGKSVWEVYPELLGTIAEANCHRALAEHTPLHFEYRDSVSNRWADVSIYPATGGGLSAAFREITDEKQAQAMLRENEERFRFSLEAANVGTWEWNIATGEDRWSENMESIHGMPPGFHGKIEDMIRTVHPQDRDMVRGKIRRGIESGEQYEVEYRTIGQDGKVGWVEAKGRVLYDRRTGQPLRMIGISTNITERKNAEQALRDSEARFRTLARHAPVGIFQLDRNGSNVFVNERWRTQAGMTPEQALDHGWLSAVHPDDRDGLMRVRSEAIGRGQRYTASYRVQAPDGKLTWVETLAVPIRDNSGELTGYIGTAIDMTEHKLWADELARANKEVSDVLESITEMFIAVDREWRFTYANRPAIDKIGKSREEILGKNIWKLIPELTATAFRSPFERVMAERVPIDFEFVGPRGTWLDVHAHPAEGGLSAYVLDVTERKKNEEELSRLAAIVESSDDAILSLAVDGTVLTWNGGAERIYGYSAQEMIGRNLSLIDRRDGQPDERERMLESVKRGESVRYFQTTRIRKDGRLIWISITASPIRDRRGEVVAISTSVRDITEIKVLEEQLRQAAKLESLGVLAGGIAHDFNNLLVGILGNASLVSDLLPPTSPARPMLDGVINAGERAAMLTQQMLAYSGKGKFVIQPVDISDLVREMTTLVQASVPKTVALRLRLAPGLPPVVADVAQLQQLIMNLVINGAEAIGDHPGSVTVTTGEQQTVDGESVGTTVGADPVTPGKYVFFEVQDNGAGMDGATIAKIFDPFFTTKFTGRGLGLSAALGIVRGHEGFMQVASSPGRGSTFKVLFPAAQEKITPPPVRVVNEDLSGSGVILLVDDEVLVRRIAATTLAHHGYTILEAGNGLEAIELFQRNSSRIALVVLDLSMPLMGGEECLSRLKSIKPDVPVLLSSGFSETEAARCFQSAGVASFLQKPYTAQQLAELVKAALSGRGRTSGRIA
ncbi:MAG: sensor hybrid histidine kinase [Bryobacterales bacterium]|nr:sensor hybrid histidine kinase [Bryobacterales bacterium]